MTIEKLKRPTKKLRASHLGGAIVASSFLALCWATLDNGVSLNELKAYVDPIDLAFALSGHRLAYSTGYPLFTLLGWLWYQVGRIFFFFNPTERLALLSALQAMGALIFMYAILLRLLKGNMLIAGLITLLFGTTETFWTTSNTLEVYPLNLLIVTAVVWLLMKWEREDRYLPLVGFLLGAGLAHHRTIVLLMPAVALFVLLVDRKVMRRGKVVTLSFLATLLPLSTYLYLPIRASLDPALTAYASSPWRWSWEVIWATGYQRDLINPFLNPPAFFRELIASFQVQGQELTIWGTLLGWLGLALLFDRERWRWGAFFAVSYLCYFYFGIVYPVYDRQVMLIPASMFLVMGMGVVAERVWRLSDVLSGPPGGLTKGAIALLLAVSIMGRLVNHFPLADQRDLPTDDGLLAARKIVADNPQPGATIVASYEEGLSLEYYTMVWGKRGDLKVVVTGEGASPPPPEEKTYLTCTLAKYLWGERLAPHHPSAVGNSLLQLNSRPREHLPTIDQPYEVIYEGREEGKIALLGYDLERISSTIHLALYWRGEEKMDKDYSVFVHLVAGGEIVAQADSRHPVCDSFPISQISRDELVRDAHELHIPSHYQGPLEILVGLYDPEDPQLEKLRGVLLMGERVEAVTIKVEP